MLQRVLHSLKHKWLRNVMIVILFTVMFTISIGSMVLYSTVSNQVEFLEKSVKNSVTLLSMSYRFKTENVGITQSIDKEVAEAFLDSEYVSDYNFAALGMFKLKGAEPLYKKEKAENLMHNPAAEELDVYSYVVANSEMDPAFTVNGFQLVEGSHLSDKNEEQQGCLVSKEFAELNSLVVGDTFKFKVLYRENDYTDIQVKGIFSAPETQRLKGIGNRPEEIIFTSYKLYSEKIDSSENDKSFVTAYLKDDKYIGDFLKETEGKLNIGDVIEKPSDMPVTPSIPEEYADMTHDEFFEFAYANPIYRVVIDKEWYTMVAAPLEKVQLLAGVMTIAMLFAVTCILVLITILSLKNRKKEMGILLAIGESRARVILQMIIEALLPVIIAMLFGILLGSVLGIPIAEGLCNGVYTQSTAETQGVNNVVTFAHQTQNQYSTDTYSGAYWVDLLDRAGFNVMVFPKAKAVMNMPTIVLYLLISLALALISVVIQVVSIIRVKPARILTGKG